MPEPDEDIMKAWDAAYAKAYGEVRNKHDAEDIATDALIWAVLNHDPEVGTLIQAAVHKTRFVTKDHYRSAAVSRRAWLENFDELAERNTTDEERRAAQVEILRRVHDVLPNLSEKQRIALLLIVRGVTGKEFATELRMTESGARNFRARLREKLRNMTRYKNEL